MKKIFLALGVIFGAAVMMAGPVGAYTCPSGTVQAGNDVDSAAKCNVETTDPTGSGSSTNGVWYYIKNIINLLMGICGLIAVVVIIIGGINFMVSQGDTAKVKKAREMILYGIIGLVVSLLAFAIVNFVLGNVFGSGSSSGSGAGSGSGSSGSGSSSGGSGSSGSGSGSGSSV